MNTLGMEQGLPDITGNIKRGINRLGSDGFNDLSSTMEGVRRKASSIQNNINSIREGFAGDKNPYGLTSIPQELESPGIGKVFTHREQIPQELESPGMGKIFTDREQIPQELSTPFSPRNVTPPNTQALLGGAAAGSGVAAGLTALGNKVARSKTTPLTQVSSKFMRESNLRQAEFGFMPYAMDMLGQVQLPSTQLGKV
jgi:hypothetical protein